MTSSTDSVPLVYTGGRRVAPGAPVSAIVWIGDSALFTLGDGAVLPVALTAEVPRIAAHDGAVLTAARHPDGRAIVTGGDDGRVLRVDPAGCVSTLGAFGRDWVGTVVASAKSGVIAAAVGRQVHVWLPGSSAPSHTYDFASTVGGVALDERGKRLAVSYYGGAALLYPMAAGSGRVALQWAGSHLGCTLSPDCGYLVTATQELGLHGWRLPLGTDMAMRGYKAKTRSFSWDRRARWLATSGDDRAIVWPFDGKTGPMNRSPKLLGTRQVLATTVAFHPARDVLAIGYADGAVVLARVDDDAITAIDEPGGGAVTALAWSDRGTMLAYGDEDGGGGILAVL